MPAARRATCSSSDSARSLRTLPVHESGLPPRARARSPVASSGWSSATAHGLRSLRLMAVISELRLVVVVVGRCLQLPRPHWLRPPFPGGCPRGRLGGGLQRVDRLGVEELGDPAVAVGDVEADEAGAGDVLFADAPGAADVAEEFDDCPDVQRAILSAGWRGVGHRAACPVRIRRAPPFRGGTAGGW